MPSISRNAILIRKVLDFNPDVKRRILACERAGTFDSAVDAAILMYSIPAIAYLLDNMSNEETAEAIKLLMDDMSRSN